MKLAIISSAPLIPKDNTYQAYGPYIKEMAIWAQYADDVAFVSPVWESDRGLLCAPVAFPVARLFEAKDFNVTSPLNLLNALRHSLRNFYRIYQAMRWADHIHLRCPGNLGLMACIVQIFFPAKKKTAKYAGNWDPKAKQPWSYKLQRWILANTFLTKNMQVLVYGAWPNSTLNIKPFFTASYRESQKTAVEPRDLSGKIRFLFVGTLSEGKRPQYALQLVMQLHRAGHDVAIDFFGEGLERQPLEALITRHNLSKIACLRGNRTADEIQQAYRESHFLLLPSKSEGWPKVVAEAMFWGCLPLATNVSCVSYMLGHGNRGVILSTHQETDFNLVLGILANQEEYRTKVLDSISWSRQFTLDLFEKEIKALLT
ncbi:Glycosyltransferase family 1 protein [Flavobacterium longum]|uniref:glycosyltransferase n=1 Tax=Flavobacterium longum TaxID=1299340 RepID=UPI0039E76B6B